MGVIKTAFLLFKFSRSSSVDDSVDRLLHGLSSLILLSFSTLILFRLFAQDVFFCWENAYDSPLWNEFIKYRCSMSDLYFVSPSQIDFPTEHKDIHTNFYYWVPLIFVIGSWICCFPFWIWKSCHWYSGIYVKSWMNCFSTFGYNKRAAKSFLGIMKYNEARYFFGYGNSKNWFSNCYCFYKILNISSVGLILLLLHWFSSSSYDLFGVKMALGWKKSGHFPRVMYCDFVRFDEVSGLPMNWTSQCLLPYNAMSKKIHYIENYLSCYGIDRTHRFFYKFVDHVFKRDSMTLFWILNANAAEIDVSHFLLNIWTASKESMKIKEV